MGPKPRVNTRYVETMTTLRQHSDLIAGGEFRQTDSTLGEFLRRWRIRRVGDLRQRTEDFLFQSFIGRSYRRLMSLARVRGGYTPEPGASRDGE